MITEKEWRKLEKRMAQGNATQRMYRRTEKAWKKEREQARNNKQFAHTIAWQ